MLTWATTRFVAIQVRHDPRQTGVSNYTFRKLFRHAMNMMTGFSTLPLQMANSWVFDAPPSVELFWCSSLGDISCTAPLSRDSPFWRQSSRFFPAPSLLALGIIGEYLARMHFRMMERPTYTVREEVAPRDKVSMRPPHSAPCELLPWDTEFFGCRIARVSAIGEAGTGSANR